MLSFDSFFLIYELQIFKNKTIIHLLHHYENKLRLLTFIPYPIWGLNPYNHCVQQGTWDPLNIWVITYTLFILATSTVRCGRFPIIKKVPELRKYTVNHFYQSTNLTHFVHYRNKFQSVARTLLKEANYIRIFLIV